MNHSEILAKVDHTLLAQTATWAQIKEICDDAVRYGTASVCIPPAYVKQAKEYVKDRMAVCTVIGFPTATPPPRLRQPRPETLWKTGRMRSIW